MDFLISHRCKNINFKKKLKEKKKKLPLFSRKRRQK